MDSGIYEIRNKLNNKVYIGQTINLKTRFKSHLFLLRNNKHKNKHLQSSFNKHGVDNFSFNVIEVCENLNERECYWIEYFGGLNPSKVYNQSTGGLGGGKRSASVRHSISKWQTGRSLTKEHAQNIGIGNTGKIVSQSQKDHLSSLYRGRKLSDDTKRKISISKTGVLLSKEQKEKRRGMGSIPVLQFSLSGEFVGEFSSAKDAGEKLGFWKSDITQNCLGNRNTVKGFIFKYKHQP